MRNVQLHISGEVYKVGFRYYLKQMAGVFHVTGYVKYAGNKTLQVEVQGEHKDVDKFISCCRLGCISSDVEEITLKERPAKDFETFEII